MSTPATLDEAYLDALIAYQEAQYLAAPPLQGALGLVRFGKLQEDPTAYPAIALLRYGDRDDPTWVHEMIQVQGDMTGTTGSRGVGLWGRLREVGSIGTHWWHRYTEELIRYKINTTDTRFQSMAEGIALAWWLARTIQAATPYVLRLPAVEGQSLLEPLVTRVRPREGGGPENYIWKITLQIQCLVHHAT